MGGPSARQLSFESKSEVLLSVALASDSDLLPLSSEDKAMEEAARLKECQGC